MSTIDISPRDIDLFVSNSQDLLAIADIERLQWVSPRWTDVLGWSAEELRAHPFLTFVHPDDVAATIQEATRLAEGAPAVEFLNRYRCKDGSYRWLEWNTVPSDEGLLYCIVRDVTRRITTQRELERRAELLAMSNQLAQVGNWYLELADPIVHWSPEVYRIHGLDPGQFTPNVERGIDCYHLEDRAMVAEKVNAAIAMGSSFEFEARIVRPTGEIRLVHALGQARRGPAGNVEGVFGVFRDITDDERVQRTRDLEQFTYVASHDLRQPVRTIRQYLRVLAEEYELGLDEEGERYLGFVMAASERLDRLVRDLGRYTRAGNAPMTEPVDLESVVREATEHLQPEFERRDGTISVHGRLPRVLGEMLRLEQVFEHLVDNALRFAGDEPPRVTITSVPDARSGSVTVLVSDQGTGFDAADGEKIFEPFRRLAHHDDRGTGIGLAIVRRIVQGLGGQVWAQGEQGRGATFFVRLPLAKGDKLTPFFAAERV